MSEQYVIPLEYQPLFRFDNFIQCPGNSEAFTAVFHLGQEIINHQVLYIYGSEGTGKTHLCHALLNQRKYSDNSFSFIYLTFKNYHLKHMSEDKLNATNETNILIIEDVHLIQNSRFEETVFGLFNIFVQRQKPIIVTSQKHPNKLNSLHKRMTSRFASGTIINIDVLNEDTCIEIVKKIAKDHQVLFPDKVIQYLIKRVPRNPQYLRELFTEIDKFSLQSKKPISITLVKKVLNNRQNSIFRR